MKLQVYDNEDGNDAQDQQRYMRGRIFLASASCGLPSSTSEAQAATAPTTRTRGAGGALARARARGAPPSIIIKPAWRLHLYNPLERRNSSTVAVLVHVVVTALIVFSALVTSSRLFPTPSARYGATWGEMVWLGD
jgi:hypothetical protein